MQYKNKCTIEIGGKIRKITFSLQTYLDVMALCEQKDEEYHKKTGTPAKDCLLYHYKKMSKNNVLSIVTHLYYAILEINDYEDQDLPADFSPLIVRDWFDELDVNVQQEIIDAMAVGLHSYAKKVDESKPAIEKLLKEEKKKIERQHLKK